MAYVRVLEPLKGRRDRTTIRGVDTTERIFYVSPFWLDELLIQNNGTYDLQIRLNNSEKPITVEAGSEINLDGEIAYFLASAGGTENIDILYKPTKKPIAKKVPPIGLYFDGIDDYAYLSKTINFENQYLTISSYYSIFHYTPLQLTSAIIRKGYGYLNTFAFEISNPTGKLKFDYYYNGQFTYYSEYIPPLHHPTSTTISFTPSTLTFYNNKKIETTFTNPHPIKDYPQPILIGGWYSSSENFNGFLYSIYLYNHTLEPTNIIYTLPPLSPNTTLILSPYSVDIVNSKWYDLSGNENHATLYGPSLKELWRPEQ